MTTFARLALVVQSKIPPCNWIERAFITVINALKLPAVGASDKGKYLHTNSSTGALEWAEGGGGGSSVDPYDSTPANLGTAAAGSSDAYARGDHVHAMPSASDVGAVAVPLAVTLAGTTPTIESAADNTVYTAGEVTSLTVTAAALNIGFVLIFTSGSVATNLSLPVSIVMPDSFTVEPNKRYEINIWNGYAAVASWTVTAGE